MTPPFGQIIGFAHRGGRASGAENTIAAFSRALELGATGLETDAWITADGAVVLDHDGVLGPLWRRRAIAATAAAALPPHIPSLADLYSQCGTDFELSIDVKDPAALLPLIEAAGAFGAAGRLWLCHHDWRVMAGWRAGGLVPPECRLVESSNLAWMKEGLGTRVSALSANGLDALNLHRSQWSDEAVREVHAVGLRAFGWDAQTADELAQLVTFGVDGVYSDHVERMMAALRAV
jgi:glycerophosphoryl diester phosphodiesterase